ncbi:MAG TPA: thioredoxin family protein, partial [Zoogloea sp.]|nr:thioredoxin family protein [Zoogloea sp.]
AQEKVFNSFKAEPGLDLPLLVVDYDKERALKQSLKVRTQSTLIVYRGEKETARLAGDTDETSLRAALKSAL